MFRNIWFAFFRLRSDYLTHCSKPGQDYLQIGNSKSVHPVRRLRISNLKSVCVCKGSDTLCL